MTNEDGATSPVTPSSPVVLPRIRSPEKAAGRRPYSELNLSFRRSSASLSSIFSSTTASATLKRASTPIANLSSLGLSSSASGIAAHDLSTQTNPFKDTIVRALCPSIAVLPSPDAEDLVIGKGFKGGLLELIRPYGENISGRVTIRDSNGASRSWEDYCVKFCRLGDGLEDPRPAPEASQEAVKADIAGYLDKFLPHSSARLRTGGDVTQIEHDVASHLSFFETSTDDDRPQQEFESQDHDDTGSGAFQLLYLQRLLCGMPASAHETFSHPVACMITVSSRNQDPVEELRSLSASISRGDQKLPPWMSVEFLRYYVLLHDEEHDDIQRSQSCFEQMKRHFGLHCHLLRIRSSQCVPSDDDAVAQPPCQFITAAEELAEIERKEQRDDIDGPALCLYESDEASLKGLVRELVTQSVIPAMERTCITWNNDVVSRRRGISGRFISLSKRWTPFGGSRNSSGGNATPSNSNYDALNGYYRIDTPEAIMRRLADYAVMLRDYKLAQSVYELVRSDYSNDKAWKYYAGACEMSAVISLLNGAPLVAKGRSEGIDQLIENAVYSYSSRTSSNYYALRGIMMAVELLLLRSGTAADEAAKWTARVFESDLVGAIGTALAYEKIAAAFASRKGTGSRHWGSRQRKSALWRVMATHAWLELGYSRLASQNLSCVLKLYGITGKHSEPIMFAEMSAHLEELKEAIATSSNSREVVEQVERLVDIGQANEDDAIEELEQLGTEVSKTPGQTQTLEVDPLSHPLADDKGTLPILHGHRKSLSIQALESSLRTASGDTTGNSTPRTESPPVS